MAADETTDLAWRLSVLLSFLQIQADLICGLVVRVPGYRSRGQGSIPGSTIFSERWGVWNGVHLASLSTVEELTE
jgi:hypothetical protein